MAEGKELELLICTTHSPYFPKKFKTLEEAQEALVKYLNYHWRFFLPRKKGTKILDIRKVVFSDNGLRPDSCEAFVSEITEKTPYSESDYSGSEECKNLSREYSSFDELNKETTSNNWK